MVEYALVWCGVPQAMKPLLDAVEHALAFYRARNARPATPKVV